MFIYIHMPFCLSHCIYCDFYVELKATDDRRSRYLKALKQEISFYLGSMSEPLPEIQTLYIGGGTPALFTATEIEDLLKTVTQHTSFASDAEITLEANPEGTASPLRDYAMLGINRLSVGIQSMQPNELKRLSRVHSREQVFRFFDFIAQSGFHNISIDLMYGIPEQTQASWLNTLQQILTLPITHISMYGLKVEENTALAKLIQQGRMSTPPDDDAVDMYFEGIRYLEANGFEQYEISNFSRPGYASQHNLCYWNNEPFWGFGVSAHGYMNHIRYENPRNLEQYLEMPTVRTEEHPCCSQEQLENAIIFGLRKREGIDIQALENQYGICFKERYEKSLARYFDNDYLLQKDGKLFLTQKAIPISNEILATFIEI